MIFFGKNINAFNLNFKVIQIINIELFLYNNIIKFYEWHEYEYKCVTNMFLLCKYYK